MEVPTIPKTGIDEITSKQITDYTDLLMNHILRYGNSIPHSSKAEYVEHIARDFQDWYNNTIDKYPDVQTIECVKKAFIMTNNIPCIQEKTIDNESN